RLNGDTFTFPGTITAIATAPSITGTIYATTGSSVYVTTDNGQTWANRTPSGGSAFADFSIDPSNASVAYVVSAGFANNRVWRTTDAGATWADITGTGLPAEPVFCVQFDPGPTSSLSDDALYVGTATGVYRSTNFAAAAPFWARLGAGLPNVL